MNASAPIKHDPCGYHCKASGQGCRASKHDPRCIDERKNCERCAEIRQAHKSSPAVTRATIISRGRFLCFCAACYSQTDESRQA
jgi:hypothetical protein